MKSCIIFTLWCLLVLQIFALRDVIDDLSQGMVKCYGKLSDSEATIVTESDQDSYITEDNPIVNDFYECSFRECGFIQDNRINFYLLRNSLMQDRSISKIDIENGIKICKATKGFNLGDKVVKLLNCLGRNNALH